MSLLKCNEPSEMDKVEPSVLDFSRTQYYSGSYQLEDEEYRTKLKEIERSPSR